MGSEAFIYLDNNATTRCDPSVVAAMLPYLTDWYGNAATGLHQQGRKAGRAVDMAREQVAALIGAQPYEVIFTSGATESNNLAVLGLGRRAAGQPRRRIVTSAVEHKAILEPCYRLGQAGFEVVVLPVDDQGRVSPEMAATVIDEQTLLVTIQAANNEIGTLQPVAEVAALAHAVGAMVHCDAAQAVGKIPLNVQDLDVDLLSLSGHKFYGPKGVGALFVRQGRSMMWLEPLVYGGGQEQTIRPGTSNVPGIVGLGAAAELCANCLATEMARITEIRDVLEASLLSLLPGAWVNGSQVARLPNTTSLTIPGVDADALLLNMPKVMAGVGAACSAGALEPSHVLQAIGLSREQAAATIRLSLGRFNVLAEVAEIEEALVRAVENMGGVRPAG